MNFDPDDFMKAIGPNASLIFAAWIFLTFLQARYTNAYERYRALVEQYRSSSDGDKRHRNVKAQVFLYKRRCDQMRNATNIGVIAAILLIVSLIASGLGVIFSEASFLKYVIAASSLLGLVLVICAAALVIMENSSIREVLDNETSDLDLRE
jgi:hypothetical protein